MTNTPNDGDIPPDRRAERIPNPEATSLKGAKADDVYPDDWPPELAKRALETPEHKPAEANCGGNEVGHKAIVGSDPCLWAERISSAWRKSAEAFIETGHLLNAAKEQLSHGDWLPLVRELPFSERTAQMLMRIARDKRIANPQNISYLPPSWSVLHELTKLDDQTFSAMLREGSINPSMTKLVADSAAWVKKHRKGVRLKKVSSAKPSRATARAGGREPAVLARRYLCRPPQRVSCSTHSPGSPPSSRLGRPTSSLSSGSCRPIRAASSARTPIASPNSHCASTTPRRRKKEARYEHPARRPPLPLRRPRPVPATTT